MSDTDLDAQRLEATRYWARILRAPWRRNGNWFYTKFLRYLKRLEVPGGLERGQKARFLSWADEDFEWSEEHQHIVLKTLMPFPHQVGLDESTRGRAPSSC